MFRFRFATPAFADFGKRVVDKVDRLAGDFLQSPPCSRHEQLLLRHVGRIECLLGEWSLDPHRFEGGIDDELGDRWVAANVPFGRAVQLIRPDLAHDVAQIEIGVGDIFDVFSAHVTEIALFAFGHDRG